MCEPFSDQRDWARAQMTEVGYAQPIRTAIERLLEVWWTQNHTQESAETTLVGFSSLAQGHSLITRSPTEEVWVPLKPGNVVIRDLVRVRNDAYKADTGRMHNGRRGAVVGIRYGDVIVRYDDGKQPPFDGIHHSPHALEKRVR